MAKGLSTRDPGRVAPTAVPVAAPRAELTTLHGDLEELGLSPSEARVLVALMRVGSATAPQLSKLAGVPRTNTYPVIESLSARHLAIRVPGKGPVLWAAPPRGDVVPQLEAILVANQEERLRQHRHKAARVTEAIARLFADVPTMSHSYVQILRGPAQAKRAYDQMVSNAEDELLVCARPPYTHDPRFPNPVAVEALRRGLRTRALYEAEQWLAPASEAFRRACQAYDDAGLDWRLAEHLPVKMAIADRKTAIVSFPDPLQPEGELETTVLIEQAAYAELHAAIFDKLWEVAVPGHELPIDASTPTAGGTAARGEAG